MMVWAADVRFRTLFRHWFESQTLQGLRAQTSDAPLRALGVSWAQETGRPSQESGSAGCQSSRRTDPGEQRSPSPHCGTLSHGSGVVHSQASVSPPPSPSGQEFLPPQSSQVRHPPCPLSGPQDTGNSSHSSSPSITHEFMLTTSPWIWIR